jgi:hypothetical protein
MLGQKFEHQPNDLLFEFSQTKDDPSKAYFVFDSCSKFYKQNRYDRCEQTWLAGNIVLFLFFLKTDDLQNYFIYIVLRKLDRLIKLLLGPLQGLFKQNSCWICLKSDGFGNMSHFLL